MKKHRILFIVLAIVLLLAAAAVGVWLYLSASAQKTDAEQQSVYAQYSDMLAAVDALRLEVCEQGAPVGSYDMQTLGLREDLLQQVNAQFSQLDRLSPEQYAALSVSEKLGWAKQPRSTPQRCEANMTLFDASAILDALYSLTREAPQDAYIVLENGVYTVHDEIGGQTLDEAAVLSGLQQAASSLAVSVDGPVNATYELTQQAYIQPAVTVSTLADTPDSLFREALSTLEITVSFNADAEFLPKGSEVLTSNTLASIVDLAADGSITVDQTALAQTVSKWVTTYNQYDVPFIFDSWVKGPIQISFVTCDYLIDGQKLLEQITAQLLTMQSGTVEAEAACYSKDGQPFSLGQSYIEVDFDNQQMTFIKDGRLVVNTNIVSGALNGHQTPTGLYEAHGKEHNVMLEGEDYLVFVKYWVSVVGDMVGLHDASWRSNFGASFYVYGGSHGCVNTPEEAMAMIWYLVEDGTPVLMHGQNKWYEPADGNPLETKDPARGTTSGRTVENGTRVLTDGSSRIDIQPDDVVPFVLPEEADPEQSPAA